MGESTPDLATRDVNSASTGSNTNPRDSGKKAIKGSKEKSIMNGHREVDTELKMINPDSEEGISDMSVDELEGENQECQKAFVKPVKETQTERNKLGDIQEKINECSKEHTNNELKIEQVNTAFGLELPLSKTVEYDIVKSKTNAYSPDSSVVESEGKRKENTTESIDSIKEDKVDVREIQKSVSILNGSTLNLNESVETNKMDAVSFQEDKEMINRNESSTGDTDNEKSTPASMELKAEHTNTTLISVASGERWKEKITENIDSIKEEKDAEKHKEIVSEEVETNDKDAESFCESKDTNLEINQNQEKEVKSKDTNKLVAIQYKNEESLIKDQKDILKEKEMTLNKVRLLQGGDDKKQEEGEDNKTPVDNHNPYKTKNEEERNDK